MIVATLALAALLQQSDTVMLADLRCESCAIRAIRTASIRAVEGRTTVSARAVVVRDAQGRLLVADNGTPSQFSVHTPTGTLLSTVGRSGGGPGEFRRVWKLAPAASGFLVYDDLAKRSTLYSLNFAVLSTRATPDRPLSVLVRENWSGVMSAIVPTSELIGFTLHEFDSLGRRSRALALSRTPYREDLRDLFERELAPARDSARYWASHRREYAWQLCTFGVDSCRLYLRRAQWFPRPTAAAWHEVMGSRPPPPQLWGVSQENARFLWTLTWVPDSRWRSALEAVNSEEYRIVDFDRYYDSVVERVDLSNNSIVASHRFDEAFFRFVGNSEVWRYVEDSTGVGQIEVVRLSVSPRSP